MCIPRRSLVRLRQQERHGALCIFPHTHQKVKNEGCTLEFTWLSTQGDITVFGGGAPSAFSATNDAPAKGRLQVRPRRTELVQQPQPLETAPRQPKLEFNGDQANVASRSVPFSGSGSHTGDGVQLTPKAAKSHAEVEEGNRRLYLSGDRSLRGTVEAYFAPDIMFPATHIYW